MNKPVAWMYQINGITGQEWVLSQSLPNYEYQNEQPLYTHPVKEPTDDPLANFKPVWREAPAIKELTDEEILEVYEKCEWSSGYVYWKEFARAILRKAQEK